MKKIVVTLIVLGFIGIGVWGVISSERSESRDLDVRDPSTMSTRDGFGGNNTDLNETTCSSADGAWNPCGSACRTNPGAICIELCVEYCECKNDSECPSGYTCSDFVDGIGVCL